MLLYLLPVIYKKKWSMTYEARIEGLSSREKAEHARTSVGVKRDPQWNGKEDSLFLKGYNEMLRRLEPTTILMYGDMIEGLEGNVVHIPSFFAQRRDELNEKKRQRRAMESKQNRE